MKTEIEAKFLDINSNELRKKLQSVGAKLSSTERLMKRKILDFPDNRLDKIGGWVRVRNEGDKITMSYKQLTDRTLHGTKETNLVVDSFDSSVDFLYSLGLTTKSYQETKRESWTLNGSEIEIDTWPWIPTYVEIESPNEEDLKTVVEALGLDFASALHGSVEIVYQQYYDVSEAEINSLKLISFTDTPDLLESRRK